MDDGLGDQKPGSANSPTASFGRIISQGAVDAFIARAGLVDPSRSTDLQRTLERLQELTSPVDALISDATAVLDGDQRAADRLRALLAWDTSTPAVRQKSEAGERTSYREGVVNHLALAVLVAGVTRAARDNREATAMLGTLGALLEPLASLDAVTSSIGQQTSLRQSIPGSPPELDPADMSMPTAGLPSGVPALPTSIGLPGLPGGPSSPFGPSGPSGPDDPFGPLRDRRFRPPRAPEGEPEWDTPPTLAPPIEYIDPALCAQLAMLAITNVQKTSPRYEIVSIDVFGFGDRISPTRRACPGSRIRINGTGFGTSGTVLFPSSASPGAHGSAIAEQWSDTEIIVKVPSWATPGELRLQTLARIVGVCQSDIPVYRLGSSRVPFEGGAPVIFSVTVNGQQLPTCVAPEKDAVIAWVTSSGAQTAIDVLASIDGVQLGAFHGNAATAGSLTVHVPTRVLPGTSLHIEVRIDNNCDVADSITDFPVSVPALLGVTGLEVTQGVQHFLLSPDPWNSVPTVAGKDTVVRAYLSCARQGFNMDRLEHVTGRLKVDGITLAPINDPPEITVTPAVFVNRDKADSSLNFRIPAALSHGTRKLMVTVWGEDECGTRYARFERFWTWQDRSPFRVRWVLIADGRSNAPMPGRIITDAQARDLVMQAFDYLPTPATDIGPAWLHTWNTSRDWTDEYGQRHELLDDLDDQHNCNAWEWLTQWADDDCPTDDGATWIGIYPEDAGGGVGKRPGNTAIAGLNAEPIAHELGHTRGLKHILESCGTGEVPRGPYDSLNLEGGLLWDVAINPRSGAVVSRPTYDLMSYACNKWISAENWTRLCNGF